jgi:hypothetical protein
VASLRALDQRGWIDFFPMIGNSSKSKSGFQKLIVALIRRELEFLPCIKERKC